MQGDEKICGIVGAIGNIDGNVEKAVQQMLIFDTVRGEHSTGLLGVKKFDDEDYILAKQVGNPHELFDTQAYKKIMGSSSRILIGHNRYATQGKVNKFNAHPFDFDTLVGVHNGSLTNKYQLHEGSVWDVDSQCLYAHIQAKGIEDALRVARGAFALVWWDKESNHVNFIRNEERPLYYALTEKMAQPVMFFASEPWMIEVAAMRNNIVIHEPNQFEVGLLHSIPVGKGGVLGKPVIRPVEFAPPVQTIHYYNRGQQTTKPAVNVSVRGGNVKVTEGNVEAPTSTTTATTGAGANVVALPKKTSVMDPLFAASKGISFEAICIQEDDKQARFVACFCPSHPYLEVRLYQHTAGDRIFNAIGCVFEGDVSSFVMHSSTGGYYKISPHSVKIIEWPTKAAGMQVDDDEVDEDTPTESDPFENMAPDHHGKDIDLGTWMRKYSSCVFCSENILPNDLEDGARFTKEGEILCKGCAEDTELSRYVELV